MSGWFKHKMDAGDDPFICALMKEFGTDGYWVYFRTLELMRQNFDVRVPGKLCLSWDIVQLKFHSRRKKVNSIWVYCQEKGKFFVSEKDGEVTVICPKFKVLMDKYTSRLVREKMSTELVGSVHPSTHKVDHKNRIEQNRKDVIGHSMGTTNAGPIGSLGYRILKKFLSGRKAKD